MGRTRVQVPDVGIAGNVVVTLKPPQQLKLHPILDAGALGAPGTTPPVRLFPRSLELYSAPFDANAVTCSIDASGDFIFPNIMEGRYTVSSSGLPDGDCYWMNSEVVQDDELLWLAPAIGNSSFVEVIHDRGRRRFMMQ
jgi:hypothetical protein